MPDSQAPEVPRKSGGNWTAWVPDAWVHLSCDPLAYGLKQSFWGVEFNIPRPHMATLTWVSNPIVAWSFLWRPETLTVQFWGQISSGGGCSSRSRGHVGRRVSKQVESLGRTMFTSGVRLKARAQCPWPGPTESSGD